MSSSDLLSNKQALDLIKGISLSPALQKSKDSILLAEDQYPDHLDSIFGKSDEANDLSRTISLLKWNRKTERGSLEKIVYDKMVPLRTVFDLRYSSRPQRTILGRNMFIGIGSIELQTFVLPRSKR